MCAAAAGVVVALLASATTPEEVGAAVQLARIRADLARVPWDATEAELARALPGDGLTCTERAAVDALRPWERTCVRREPGYEAAWAFQALLLAEPLAPRLEALRVRASGLDLDAVWTLHRLLVEELDRTLPRYDGPDRTRGTPFGAGDIRRWRSAEVDLVLYWILLQSGERAIEVQAEHHHPDALSEAGMRVSGGVSAELRDRLADEVAAEHPRAAVFLVEAGPSRTLDDVSPTLAGLLEGARRAGPMRRAALLLAADLVADRAAVSYGDGSDERLVEHAGGRRFVFERGHYGTRLHHDLLPEIAAAPEGGFWSDGAYVRLLELGWDPAGGCSGAGRRRALHGVIAAAEAFLAERPASPLRAHVRLRLARAYEAWWWVSGLQEPDPNAQSVTPAERRGGERARRRAIAAYRALLRETQEPALRTYATAHLARLLLRVDTFQRLFSCTSSC